jgi:hypothetical protein
MEPVSCKVLSSCTHIHNLCMVKHVNTMLWFFYVECNREFTLSGYYN